MFGGASNIGGRCLNDFFEKEEFEMWNRGVMDVIPTKVISYPLHGRGERFPFLDPEARAFVLGDISDPQIHYAALMEGVAYAERLAFEHMQECGAVWDRRSLQQAGPADHRSGCVYGQVYWTGC